jgi:hypothetical protein
MTFVRKRHSELRNVITHLFQFANVISKYKCLSSYLAPMNFESALTVIQRNSRIQGCHCLESTASPSLYPAPQLAPQSPVQAVPSQSSSLFDPLRPPRRRSCWNCQSLAWVCYSSAFPANFCVRHRFNSSKN